jgi:hypothetical protein
MALISHGAPYHRRDTLIEVPSGLFSETTMSELQGLPIERLVVLHFTISGSLTSTVPQDH